MTVFERWAFEPSDDDLRAEREDAGTERALAQTRRLRSGVERATGIVSSRAQAHAHAPRDPTAILDDPEPLDGGFVGSDFERELRADKPIVWIDVSAALGQFAAANQISVVFSDEMLQALREPGATVGLESDLNRRRHGSASVCPRHGETRGGLCRKCSR